MEHAKLSPSRAERWLHCTPSAQLEAKFPDKPGPAAEEGTKAHALCAYMLKMALGQPCGMPLEESFTPAMENAADGYVNYVLSRAAESPDSFVLVEQRVDFSQYVPGGFGTPDCLILFDGGLEVIDFKFGKGVPVYAKDNPQLMCYALGALAAYGFLYDIKEITLSVFQPRRDNFSRWDMRASDLIAWAESELRPKAELADKGEGRLVPGEWCRFCKAKSVCRANAGAAVALVSDELKLPPLFSDAEVEEILPVLQDIIAWVDGIKKYAYEKALGGKTWKGFKLVEGKSTRKYIDPVAVAEAAKENGYTDIYTRDLLPLSRMEKLMGKFRFEEILGNLVEKIPGKLELVPASDRRQEIFIKVSAEQ